MLGDLMALEQQTSPEEKRQLLVEDALAAEAEAMKTGIGFEADEVHEAMRLRVRRDKAARPKARSWRR
jgi:hypothetical protein